MLRRVSTYSVVVALHIIAAFAAYGLPLAYPLLLPYLRRHHPESLPGVHAIQYRLNVALTGPGTIALFAAGVYLATAHDLWDEPFVIAGLVAIAIIAVVGGAVIVPATKRLARAATGLDGLRDRPTAATSDAEILLGAIVLARDLRDGGKALLIKR